MKEFEARNTFIQMLFHYDISEMLCQVIISLFYVSITFCSYNFRAHLTLIICEVSSSLGYGASKSETLEAKISVVIEICSFSRLFALIFEQIEMFEDNIAHCSGLLIGHFSLFLLHFYKRMSFPTFTQPLKFRAIKYSHLSTT